MKSTISIPTRNPSVLTTPGFETDIQSSKEDLFLLDAMNQQINGVLGQFQTIIELLDTHKKVAPVEDIQREVKKALKKIQALLNQEPGVEAELSAQASNNGGASLGLEVNPLIEDMGGMPLEAIASDWETFAEEAGISDKAELENMVKKIKDKLQEKFKNKARLANRLKATNKPSLKNAPKPGQTMTPKFKQVQAVLKYILKETPAPPAPAPRIIEAPRPRPGGF
jgi:hypothetical protein